VLENLPQAFKHPLASSLIRAQAAEESLYAYVQLAWPIVEPGTPFQDNWHIQAICEHLEAVSRGEIRNLLINIPPRCMKSLLVSVFWPTWEWIHNPAKRWLFASYAQSLSMRDSLKCRRIIESDWYRFFWGDRYKLTSDQNQKGRFENDKTGYRMATSVGGSATGEGGDITVIDDPHDAQGALSDTQRSATITWHDETWSTRLNDPKTGCRVIVMQRLHEKDLSGHVLEKGGYEHLMIPMEFEKDRKCKTVIFEDPRTKEGELLWPERIPEKSVEEGKKTLGSYASAGQFQQRPAPRGGGMFKREWFKIVDAIPARAQMVRFWDLAATEKQQGNDPDYTCGCKMAHLGGSTYICDMRRGRHSPAGVEATLKQTAQLDGISIPIWIEQEGGSSGKIVVDIWIRNLLQGYPARGQKPDTSKEVRAGPLVSQAEAGNVYLLRGPWNEDFLAEAEVFPAGAHDDQIDAASGAYSKLVTGITHLSW